MTELSNEQFKICNEYLVLVSDITGVAVSDIIAGQFAPKSKYSQRCGDFKKGGGV